MKVFGEERINTYYAGSQSVPAVAGLTGGGYVVAWASSAQDGSGDGVYAQRLDANGVAIGPEFRVSTSTSSHQTDPALVGLSDGSFVVVWTDHVADGSSYGIYAQRYSSAGVALGTEFRVNTVTFSTQHQPSVAAYNGGFLVTWDSTGHATDTSGYGVFGSRFDNAGNLVQSAGANEFQASTYTTSNQSESDVAAFADGSFVVVWRSEGQDTSSGGIYAQRYTIGGAKVGAEFKVNTYVTSNQLEPRVATLSDGTFVVVWASSGQDGSGNGVYAQRYLNNGSPSGIEFRVNESTAGGQYQPDVIGLSTGGFVVSWYNDNYDASGTGSYQDVYVREYSNAGVAAGGQTKGNTPLVAQTTQSQPVLADLGSGNYALIWTGGDNLDGSSNGIFQQLFGDPADFTRQANPELGDFDGSVTFGENAVNAGLQVLDAAVSLSDADSANFGGGRIEMFLVSGGSAQDQFGVRNQGAAPGEIGVSGANVQYGGVTIGTLAGGVNGANLVINLNASATVNAVEALIQNLAYSNTSANPAASRQVSIRVSDGDGGSTMGGVMTINVTPQLDGVPAAYGEERVNTYTPGTQHDPEIASLTGGGYVVVWTSNGQDGSGDGVYAQRYSASGVAVGPEFQVNSETSSTQQFPHAVGLSDGGFVIVWQDSAGTDGSGWGVIGQRYNASGVAQGANFILNTTTAGSQYHGALDAYAGNGGTVAAGFAAVWSSSNMAGGSGQDIVLQRFNNAGTKLGAEVLVNTVLGSTQHLPDVAAYANGNLVIVWEDHGGSDGAGYGVFARRFDAAAGSFGAQFQVNTITAGNQYEARVATLSNGGFVVVWGDSGGQDGSGWATFARVYNAAGTALGDAFQVNEYTAGSQYQPTVTGLSTGGFVVSFYNDNIGPDNSYYDTFIREYTNAGVAIDGDRRVNSPGNTAQYEPAIADLGSGNFVVAWRSDSQDSGSTGVYQQLFGNTAELPRQTNPDLGDFTGTVTFDENLVNASLQVIDAAVSLTDADSSNFNGGRLDLYYLVGAAAEDQLGVVHQGSGAGQIGVAGAVLSYGGVAIGTISGGANGANLRIDFTSNTATPEVVELVVQRLGYANTDSSPNASRTLGLRLADGDGGSSPPNVLTINITPQLDGVSAAYGEELVNTYTPGTQHDPEIASLTGGGYVVVWTSNGQDGSGDGVYAQRYSASGVAVGPEFQVNSETSSTQQFPHAAGLSDGGFVVVWQDSAGTDGSGWGVIGQRYNASGVAQGANFILNTTTAGSQYHGALDAYAGNGGTVAAGFAAVWSSSNMAGGSGQDIVLQRFNNAGTKLGAEVLVNTVLGSTQHLPDVAAYANGNLVIVWEDHGGSDGAGYGVFARRFDAAAGSFGAQFQVNTITAGNQYEARVATLSNGGFVVVWGDSGGQDGSGWATFARVYNAAGTALGDAFQVNEYTAGSQYQPTVTGLSTGGFVVSFYNDNIGPDNSYYDTFIREYTNAGVAIDGDRRVNSPGNTAQYEPAIADLGSGNFVVAWRSDSQDSGTTGVYQQLFGNTAELPRQTNPDLGDFTGTVTFDENLVNASLQVIDAAVSLTDADSSNFNGGRLDLYYLVGAAAEDQLGVVHQGSGAGQIGVAGAVLSYGGVAIGTISGGANGANLRIDFTSNTATPEVVELVVQRLGYANTDSSPNASRTLGLRLADGDGGSSPPNVLTINITPQLDGTPAAYGEERVNTYTPGTQYDPEVAGLTGGGYVVTWTSSGQDGDGLGVYAQRYSASGVAVGPEFKVNAVTNSAQDYPHAVGLSDGGFVIVWEDGNGVDGSSWGVIGQRYNAGGVAQGGNFVLNTTTVNTQYHGALAAYTGGFAAVWSAGSMAGGSGQDIVLQRFDNAGAKIGVEVLVNSVVSSTQHLPDVAAYSDGRLVVVWEDHGGSDGAGYGVFARRYDAAGAPVGAQFQVNTITAGNQYEARVATLSNGGFVVVWGDSGGQDGSGWATFARVYNAAGTALGDAFQVNEYTAGSQYQPTVTGLSTGGFVVSFYNDNIGPDNSYYDTFIREYTNAGVAIDGDRRVNSPGNTAQSEPAIADLGSGNFVVAWRSESQDGSSGGIFQQLFGNTAELPRQANPSLDDLNTTRVLGAAAAITPQIIDTDVQVQDSDSVNFDTGSLWVYFTAGNVAADTLAINNQGNGALQIGVAGANVSFGGTVIGTFAGGTAGAPLVVTFDADATPEAVRYLTQNITFEYDAAAAPGGTTNRTVAFRLFDGDGGASEPASTTVTIQPAAPAAVLSLTELESSVTLAEASAQAGVVLDVAVQLQAGAAGFNAGALTVSYVSSSGRPEDQLSVRNQGGAADQIGYNAGTREVSFEGVVIGTVNAADTGGNGDQLVVNFNAAATAAAIERLIENLQYQTSSDGPLPSRTIQVQVRDAASATSAQTMVINVTPQIDGAQKLFGEDQVNTYIANNQLFPSVATLQGANAGSYVVVWESDGQDGAGYGIHGQRYNAQGVQVGTEFQVNTYTPAAQTESRVASLADGGFVVVWRSEGQDGSSGGVYAQRYDAAGVAAGTEFRVSVPTVNDQTHPVALGLADGTFIISWADQVRDTSNYGTYAQRYASNGTPLGGDFLVNTYLPNQQYTPNLAALKNDPGTGGDETGFIAVWQSGGQDGSAAGIYAQRYASNGTPAGIEFKVNTVTSGDQHRPDVAVLSNTHVVVIWQNSPDSSVRGQIYTAAGVTIGGEFTVSNSDYLSNYGQIPHITALANGGFVVTWDGVTTPTDSGYGVYAQQFDANGTKVDGPLQLNTTIANNQHYPDVAGLSGGNFVAVWEGNYRETDGNSSHGIFQQVYGTPGSIVRQAFPELLDLEASVALNENDVNAAGVVIDPGVRVTDTDSANFDGGRLVVSVISGYGSLQAFNPGAPLQDNFSVRNQGNGVGQVGFDSGTGVVSYGATAIGTVTTNGQNGADLVILFNTASTAAGVEAVIENLTYRNPTSNPVATRKVSIVVSDGDGGQSAPRTIDINVLAQTDGAVALLSADQQVNTYTASDQTHPMIAALQGSNVGQYVIVWQSQGQDSSSWGMFGQRYDVNGSAIGPEFQINTTTPGAQAGVGMPGVGALSTGGFVVVWESPDGSSDGIFGQRYDAAGQPAGGEFQINLPAQNSYDQLNPRILGLNGGAFVVAYTDNINADGNSYGVRLQHYDASGVAVGLPFTVNTTVVNHQSFTELAKLADGGYVVTWHSLEQDGNNWGMYARLMNSDGTPRSNEIPVNTYTPGQQANGDVAVLASGDFIVSWISDNASLGGWSTMAQRFTSAGIKVGGEVLVSDGSSQPNGDTYAHIAALDTGGYVVTWSAPTISSHEVYAQQFNAAGEKVDAPLRMNSYTHSTQYRPDVAGLPGGRFVGAWQSYVQDGDQYGIYQNLFGPAGSLTRSAAPEINDLAPAITVLENAVNLATGVLIDASVSVSDADSANLDGGRLTISVISGYNSLGSDLSQNTPQQDQFSVRNQGTGPGQVSFNAGTGAVSYANVHIGSIVVGFNGQDGADLVIQFNAGATAEAVEALIENITYRNASSDPVASRLVSVMLTDGDGGSSVPRTLQINVTPEADGAIPLFDAEQVNTYTSSTQSDAAMANLADGGYVTMWQSNGQDGWGYGIFGQRFAGDGTRVGNEFRVSDYTPHNQTEVAAAGLTNGGFVAVYRAEGRDASGAAIIGQRFDANGIRSGPEFLVNTSSGGNQYQPDITALADGGFAVAWYSDGVRDGEYYDVFFQRFNAAGQAVGLETRANTPIAGQPFYQQYEPSIIQLGNGNIVVAWRSDSAQDGSLSGVYAQRFNGTTGAPIGSEFRLNVYTDDYQYDPQLAATSTGFVAVWTSRGQDSSADGIYGRLYDSNGNPTSAEFRVSESFANYQWESSVAPLASGGFVVTWRDNSPNNIYSQQFDALGNRIDGETILDGATTSETQPVVVGLNNGNFVVSWHANSDADGTGIFQRIVGNPADFPRQNSPEIVDLRDTVTFLENQINDTPQLIDPGVGVLDIDSANFAGGRLDVSYVTPYGNADQFDIPGINAQDQLGIRNEGTGTEQIGVSGNNVTYNFGNGAGAVVIGTILANGVNGNPLTVLFNANATPEAAEALVENLTYQNSLSNPEPSRTISLSLSDGDGGVTLPKAITINITAQPDGAVPFGAEKIVNTTLPGTQGDPAIAYLSNNSYVVVWVDESGQDGSGQGVFARVYDSNDNAIGNQFQINTTTPSVQYQPSVVALVGGGFAVAWAGVNQISGSSGYDVVGRKFGNDGAPASAEFVINNPAATYFNYEQSMPDLAALQNGGFVAMWHAYFDQANTNYAEIWGQRFSSTAVKDGAVFKVNTSTGFEGNYQADPSVTTLTNGRFVVVWRSDGQDGSSAGVYGQRFNANGTPDGVEFRANTYTANGQYQQDVAALNDGGYVVVWGSDSAQDTSGWGVYGQRFDSSGAPVGGEFRVNYSVSGTQNEPAVSPLVNGGFVVSWTDGDEIWLQQYDASGRKVDSQQAVNPDANYGYSSGPDLVPTPDGGFIVAYQGYNYGNSTYEVFLQRFSNTAPLVQDVSVVGPEDAAIILTDDLFAAGFFDAEGQALAAIKVVTLPASGLLKLDGVNVVSGQVISVADLAANKLTYQGNLNFNGPDQFRWNGSDGNVFATASVFTNITVNNVNDGPALEAGVDGTANEGAGTNRVITIGDPDTTDVHLVTVSWLGSGGQSGSYQFSTGSPTPTIGLTLPDNANYAVTVTVNDQQGQSNSVEVDSFNMVVANVAPTISMTGNNTVEQNQPYTLDLASPSDPGTDTVTEYRIDWGDSTPVQIILASNLPANGLVTHTFASAGQRIIVVGLVDEDGLHPNAGSKTITVAAPAEVIVVDAGIDTTFTEGALFSRTITFTDPADQDPAGRNVSVDWGDGTAAQNFRINAAATNFNIQHVFADNRAIPYTVNVTVDDDGFQSDSDSFTLAVADVAPTLSLFGSGSTPEGSSYTLTLGSVNDPGTDVVSQYIVHWGDGSSETVLVANLPANRELQHVYADGNIGGTARTITVDVVNEDGTFLVAGSRNISVANVAPAVPVSGANSVAEGSVYTLTVGTLADPGTDTPTLYRINWGDGSSVNEYTPAEFATLVAGGGNVNHVFADGGNGGTNRTITLQVLDEDGTHTAGTKALTVTNVAPGVVLGGGASTNEGASYTLNIVGTDAAGASDTLSYSIDWGDGSAAQLLTASQLDALSGNVTHTYADDQDGPVNASARNISVTVSDEDGGSSNTGKTVTVNNVAPSVALSGASSAQAGQPYTLNLGALTDPGSDTVTSFIINWGDGSSPQTVNSAGNVNHTFASAGNNTITVSLVDEDGTFVNPVSLLVSVGAPSATLSLEAGANAALDEGQTFMRTINFGDGTDNGTPGWGYSIDYGDGSAAVSGTTMLKSLNLSHLYADGTATRTVSVTVTDEVGESAADSFAVMVNNVAPTAPVTGAGTVAEGALYTLNVGAITEPGADTRTGYSIDWGDGTTDSLTAAQWASAQAAGGTFTHTYADGGNSGTARTVTVSATDEDGSFVLGTKALTVTNVAPVVVLGGGASTNEGASYTLNIVGTDAAGASDTLSYSIDWGDGSAAQLLTASQLDALSGNVTHTYTDDQDGPVNASARNISVTVSDEDGGSSNTGKTVTVNNVAPTAPVTGAGTVAEGALYTLNVGAITEPGADTRTGYSIDWGDGTTDSLTAAQWASAQAAGGTFTHTYADGGNSGTARTVTVSATDEDGSFVLGTKALTVTNVAPVVVLGGGASTNEGASYTLNIVGTDAAGASDTLSYSIDWGDGSAAQLLTASQVDALSGNVTHTYADDQDGPVNASARNISVTVSDEDGGSSNTGKTVTVNNVAPSVALSGASSAQAGQPYTLNLGALTDPGSDTVTSFIINWGDGSSPQTVNSAGNVNHTFASAGNNTITVSLVDEDGTFVNPVSLLVSVGAPSATLSLEAGANAALDEGQTFMRTINFGDGTDNGTPGWGYSIDYGDGSAAVSGTTMLKSLNLSHLYADGTATRTVSVTVTDEVGESAADSFAVMVNNVAPTAPVTGAGTVAEGALYTLNVGAITEPGADTRTGYSIDWGDGTTDSLTAAQWASAQAAGGTFTHTYADGGNSGTARTVTVSATDEDGSFVLGTKALTVTNVAPVVVLGGGASTNEGASYTLNIVGTDAAGASDTLSYSIDWGDGSAAQLLTASQLDALSGNVTHTYTDDQDGPVNASARNISVTVSDEDGGSSNTGKTVTVNNVAPTAPVTGAGTVAEGALYTLNVGAITEPGADTRTGYSIDWGDGTTDSLTAAQWASAQAAGGTFTHTYADGGNSGTARTVTVSATDEDGSFVLGTKALTVTNVAPVVVLGGGASTNEGASYTLNIVGTDAAGASDTLSYSIDWGDGSAAQLLTASQVDALSGNVTHTYADDQDGPVNASARNISVTVSDEDGGSSNTGKTVTVNNVAPVAAVSGPNSTTAGSPFTLLVGTSTDPGTDVRSGYTIDWGDGSTSTLDAAQWAAALGQFSHTFGTSSTPRTITVSATDEDGTFVLGSKIVTVDNTVQTLRMGDAPARETGLGKEWSVAWTNAHVGITHKADYTNAAEVWSNARFTGALPQLLSGNDVFAGDLGVSGQSVATSAVRQEIDGKEGLRFALDQDASGLTLFLSRLFAQDDGGAFVESGRVRLLAADGSTVVGESMFHANSTAGSLQVALTPATAFRFVELNAGGYNGANFDFGAYANPDGSFGSSVNVDPSGAKHGSDFMIDAIEFQLPVLGVPPGP